MSIEERLVELTEAINTFPAAMAELLQQNADSVFKFEGKTRSGKTVTGEFPNHVEPAEEPPQAETKSEAKAESTENVAGRKTLVWNKKDHTGQVIEKGEVVPTGDDLVNVGKSKWEDLCKKYDLDVKTGQPTPKSDDESGVDDFDDLDESTPESASESADDLDLGLEDDNTSALTRADVKNELLKVMKYGREEVLKVMKKFGARNFEEIKEADFEACYAAAQQYVADKTK